MFKLYNNTIKEADIISKNIKKQKRDALKTKNQQQAQATKTCHTNFEKNRKIAATVNKHLQPKARLNVLQTKMAYEAELIYREQMATFNKNFHKDLLHANDDDDLDDFKLTPQMAKKQCMAHLDKRPKILLSSFLPSHNNSCDNYSALNPLANSTRLNATLTSDIGSPKRFSPSQSIIEQPSLHPTPNTTQININQNNLITTSITHQQTLQSSQIQITDNFYTGYSGNISDIPLPVSAFDIQATEDISFFTSFYIAPINSTATIQHRINNHIICNTPPKSPQQTCSTINRRQPGLNLIRITVDNDSYDNSLKCRKCCVNIKFNNLLIIANRMPKGRQTFCAECLLLLSSRPKDKNVDYFIQQQ